MGHYSDIRFTGLLLGTFAALMLSGCSDNKSKDSIDCASVTVGGTWIPVPGDSAYGTSDFCVMKYSIRKENIYGQFNDGIALSILK